MDENKLSGHPEMGNNTSKKNAQTKTPLVDEHHLQMIRRKLFEFHILKKEVPTVDTVLKCLKDEENFKCTPKTLCRILREDGYRFGRRQVYTVRKEPKADDADASPAPGARLIQLEQ